MAAGEIPYGVLTVGCWWVRTRLCCDCAAPVGFLHNSQRVPPLVQAATSPSLAPTSGRWTDGIALSGRHGIVQNAIWADVGMIALICIVDDHHRGKMTGRARNIQLGSTCQTRGRIRSCRWMRGCLWHKPFLHFTLRIRCHPDPARSRWTTWVRDRVFGRRSRFPAGIGLARTD